VSRTDAMTHEQGSAPERLRAGASLEEVSRAFPGSRVIDGALVLEPEVIYAGNGEAEVRYLGLTPEQAVRRYADMGDWGVQDITEWVDIYTYRKGFDAAGEPEAPEAREAISRGIQELVERHGGAITGQSLEDEMTLGEMFEKRLEPADIEDAREEAAAIAAAN